MKTIHKMLSLLLALFILLTSVAVGFCAFAKTDAKNALTMNGVLPKYISIVYDDSGSMVNGDDPADKNTQQVKRWAQAKYSLEAFISMLDDNDMLDIYKLNDGGKKYAEKTIVGSERKEAVDKIHKGFKTGDCGAMTPISALKKAAANLQEVSPYQYDRWLVVITDGEFDEKADTQSLLDSYGSALGGHVIYIPIETDNNYTGSYFKTLTAGVGEILSKVQESIEIIYADSRNKLDDVAVGSNNDSTTIDIVTGGLSMSKIIVFAQKEGVSVEGTNCSSATYSNIKIKYTEAADAVEYDSQNSFKGHENVILTDETLEGVVATIEPDDNHNYIESQDKIIINMGKASLKASDVTVYYQPAVEVVYSLEDSEGNSWLSSDSSVANACVSPGQYILKADIVDSGKKGSEDNAPLNSKLVNPMKMTVNFNGSAYDLADLRNGVMIDLDKNFDRDSFDARASILDDRYTVSTDDMLNMFHNLIVKETYKLKVDYTFPEPKPVKFTVFSKTDFSLHSLGKIKIDNEKDVIIAKVTCINDSGDKVPITDEIWSKVKEAYEAGGVTADNSTTAYIGVPKNDQNTNVNYEVAFQNVNSDGQGVFYVVPRYALNTKNGKIDKKHTTHKNYIHKSDKYNCQLVTEINLSNITPELAYSTAGASVAEKTAVYEIALCVLHTLITLALILYFAGYLLKKKLPNVKKANSVLTSSETYKINRRTKKKNWEVDDIEIKETPCVKIKPGSIINWITFIFPWLTQRGEVNFSLGNIPTLKIAGTERWGKRLVVKILNRPEEFECLNGISVADKGNAYLRIDGKSIDKSLMQKTKKAVKVKLKNISYGCESPQDRFKMYSGLSFDKKKTKGKKSKGKNRRKK